ncbi:MAG: hypothetical protein R3F62_03265 [Planctomycetota bacterium]
MALVFCGTCLAPCLWLGVPRSSVLSWEELGSIQVLAGPDEAWVFVQVDRVVVLQDPLASAPRRTIGHRQAVAVIERDGDTRVIPVARPNGVTFGSYLTRAFRDQGRVCLLEDESLGQRRSVFVWEVDRFRLLPLDESEALLSATGLDALGPSDLWAAVDARTAANGWSFLPHDLGDFTWSGARYRVSRRPQETFTEVVLRRLDTPDRDPTVLGRFDPRRVELSSDEAHARWGGPDQRGHRR